MIVFEKHSIYWQCFPRIQLQRGVKQLLQQNLSLVFNKESDFFFVLITIISILLMTHHTKHRNKQKLFFLLPWNYCSFSHHINAAHNLIFCIKSFILRHTVLACDTSHPVRSARAIVGFTRQTHTCLSENRIKSKYKSWRDSLFHIPNSYFPSTWAELSICNYSPLTICIYLFAFVLNSGQTLVLWLVPDTALIEALEIREIGFDNKFCGWSRLQSFTVGILCKQK